MCCFSASRGHRSDHQSGRCAHSVGLLTGGNFVTAGAAVRLKAGSETSRDGANHARTSPGCQKKRVVRRRDSRFVQSNTRYYFNRFCCWSTPPCADPGISSRNGREKPMADLTHVLHAKAIELGRLAIRATTSAGSGHPTTALSLAHLVTVLMYRVMRWTPAEPRQSRRRPAGAERGARGADPLCRVHRSRRRVRASTASAGR